MKKLEQIEGQTFSQKAYCYLRKAIIDNEYEPGEPISEKIICNELGFSRTPVREAFKLLEKENLIKVYPKRGAFITNISLEKIQEIFQIRQIVEGEVSLLVAPYISKDKLSQIERKLLNIKEKLRQEEEKVIEEAVMVGRELHKLIFETLGNRTLIRFIENLEVEIKMGCDFASRRFGNVSRFLDQHLEIIRALMEENGEKSKKLMSQHIKEAKESLLA